jgi:hypothetical protein
MKYIKLRPANQSLIQQTLNTSILEVMKITQGHGIMSNEIDNLFRCKKVYRFTDGEKVYIPKIVPAGHNLYSFLAHILTDLDLNEPIPYKTVNCMFKSVELIKKALLLGFSENNLSLLQQLNQLSSLHKEISNV